MGSSWALGPELVHQQSWPKALAQHLRPREPKNWLVSWRWTYLGLNFDTYSICLLKSRFEDGLDYPKLVGKTNLEQSCAETIKISQIPILCCLSVIAKRNCNSLGPDLLVNTPILLIVLPVPLYWRPQNKQIQFPNFLRSEAPTSAATEISSYRDQQFKYSVAELYDFPWLCLRAAQTIPCFDFFRGICELPKTGSWLAIPETNWNKPKKLNLHSLREASYSTTETLHSTEVNINFWTMEMVGQTIRPWLPCFFFRIPHNVYHQFCWLSHCWWLNHHQQNHHLTVVYPLFTPNISHVYTNLSWFIQIFWTCLQPIIHLQ